MSVDYYSFNSVTVWTSETCVKNAIDKRVERISFTFDFISSARLASHDVWVLTTLRASFPTLLATHTTEFTVAQSYIWTLFAQIARADL